MSSSDIISIIKGVRLSLAGSQDLSRYKFKTKTTERFNYHFLEKVCKNEHDARLLGAGLFWEKVYHTDLEESQCNRILHEWKWRYEKPSSILSDVDISTPNDISVLIKESSVGPTLLNLVNQKQIHPITFCYIDKLTGCSIKWTSLNWKLSKQKFEMLQKVVDIREYSVIQLARYLKNTFNGESNE